MMTKNFYTNVQSIGGKILYRGVRGGKKVKVKIDYEPKLYLPATKVTTHRSLEGLPLVEKKFDSIYDARDYIKKFDGVSGGPKIYGQTRYEYAFIAEQHTDMVEWDQDKIDVAIIDIEVGSENGFPDPYLANEPITAIAWKTLGGHMHVWGCGEFNNETPDAITYHKCKDEWSLCKSFITAWIARTPDVLTGWNTKFFDVPYLVNRFRKILGEDEAKKMSPWNFISERKTVINGRAMTAYGFLGVEQLDYIELYKWYAPGGKSQESYRLVNIAQVELGEGKISYDDYDNLHSLYRLNYQLFIEYNIKDVDLIIKLEDKLKLLELAVTLAYDTKTNFKDVFAQTRMWDSMTYSYLLEKGIIVPPRDVQDKDSAFEGAYVKVPQVGAHKYVASFDLNSLYPHLMMQYNISPETLIEPKDYTEDMRNILSQGVSVDKLLKKEVDLSKMSGVTITPNGQFFRTDEQGVMPEIMDTMYKDRTRYKKLALEAKKKIETVLDDKNQVHYLEKQVARYNNLQLAKKVTLNSAYGAMGNQYFRFFDIRIAEGITTAGQLSIRWIEQKINKYMNLLLKSGNEDYVIASDTDSIYLNMGPLINKLYPDTSDTKKVIKFMNKVCDDKIQPFIDASYEELKEYVNAFQQRMEMKRESLADKAIWTAKKRYILNVHDSEGVAYAKPKLKIMGLEAVKSSTPAACRTKIKEAINIIMTQSQDELQNFIEKFRHEFRKLPVEDISFPRSVNGLKEYGDAANIFKK